MRYRRDRQPGGTWFFTLTLQDRKADLLTRHIDVLRHAFRTVLEKHPVRVEAMVVLPDHLHALWRLPGDDTDYPMRWRLIKSAFSRGVATRSTIGSRPGSKSERMIWQRRYWEHRIRDDNDLKAHIDYIHLNPAKHGYVSKPAVWPYSSVHRYIRHGTLALDWGAGVDIPVGDFGE